MQTMSSVTRQQTTTAMTPPSRGARQAAIGKALTALILMAVAGYFAGPSSLPFWQPSTPAYPSPPVHFEATPLLAPAGDEVGPGMIEENVDGRRYLVRQVNPSIYKIRSWISSVGAAVAVEDLDADGLTNDACWVCPRINRVVITRAGPESPESDKPRGYSPRFLEAPAFPAFNNASVPGNSGTIAPMGSLVGDFNEDGMLDIVVYYWGRSPVLFLRNSTPWQQYVVSANVNFDPLELCFPPERWFTNAATQCDLDADGHIDIVFGNYFADGAAVLDPHSTTPVEMQDSMSHATNGGKKHFMLWQKPFKESTQPQYFREAQVTISEDGRKIDAGGKENFLRGWTLGIAAANFDANPSDLPGVYLANDFGRDVLLLPETSGRNKDTLCFRIAETARDWMTPKSKTLGHDSFKGMGACARDFDADGIPDISVSNIAALWALLESHFAFASGCLAKTPLDLPAGQMTEELLRKRVNDIRHAYYAETKKKTMPLRDVSTELGLAQSGWGWDIKAASFDNAPRLQWIRAQGFVHGHRLSRLGGPISDTQRPAPLAAGRWSVLHELATANDATLRFASNWFSCAPGDDLSGRDRLAFYVANDRGRYFDQNAAESQTRMVSSSFPAALGFQISRKTSASIDPMTLPMIGRGIAIADVDGNGMIDFLVATQGLHQPEIMRGQEQHFENSYCFINRLAPEKSGHCLELRLLLSVADDATAETRVFSGPASAVPFRGRPAIGATATFLLATADGLKVFSDTVDGGNGHSGKNSFDLHFGLGKEASVDQPLQVLIRWRDPAIPSKIQEEVVPLRPGRPGDPQALYRHTLLLHSNTAHQP